MSDSHASASPKSSTKLRFIWGWSKPAIIIRALLATLVLIGSGVPAALSVQPLADTMRNAPGSWLEDDEAVWSQWSEFCERHRFFDVILVSWPGCELKDPGVDAVTENLKELTQPNQTRVAWLTSVVSGNDVYRELVEPPMELPDKVARIRLAGVFLDPKKGQQTCLILSVSKEADFHKHELLKQIRSKAATTLNIAPEKIAIVGPPVEGDAIDQSSRKSMIDFALPSTILGAMICYLSLRSLPLMIAVMAVAIWSQSFSLGFIWWSGREMNAVFTILPVLCLVLAVSSGIHLSNYYRDSLKQFPDDRLRAIAAGMQHGLFPCGLAVATTCMGLISLGWVQLWPVQWFGYVAALSLVGTILLQFCLLPLAMMIEPKRSVDILAALRGEENRPAKRSGFGDKYLQWHGLQVLHHKYWILILMIGVMLGAGWGVRHLEASVKIDRMLSADDPLCEEYIWFEDNVSSLVTAEAEIVFPHGVVDDPYERFSLVRESHLRLRKSENVDGVLSVVTFLPNAPNDSDKRLSATARRALISSRIKGEKDQLADAGLITSDDQHEYWRLSVRYPHRIEGVYSTRLKAAEESLRPLLASVDPRIELQVLGSIPMAEHAQDALLQGLTNSFFSAFLIIYGVFLLVTRRVIASLILMIPNIFPTCVLFGILGWLDIPLDIGIVMTASVALGIAVDDTLHYLFAYRAGLHADKTRTSSILYALAVCGKAMIQTTTICALSMAVYLFSDFAPAQRFAILMVSLLAVALLADLFILPAILGSRMDRKLFQKQPEPSLAS